MYTLHEGGMSLQRLMWVVAHLATQMAFARQQMNWKNRLLAHFSLQR